MFELKKYQQRTLAALGDFLADASSQPVANAFAAARERHGMAAIPYRHYAFGEMPYVCLRLPTGGGKTVLASHAVGIAKRQYLGVDYPIVLWLVPTNIIREQTLAALKTVGHPYRRQLEEEFGLERLRVLDIGEVTQIRPQDIGSKAIVVVGTLATLRVEDTSGRKVYAYHEDFEPHFVGADRTDPRLERVQERDLKENGLGPETLGKVKYSFANILALHRPLVIMDEAHNARTKLSFDVISRIHPACVIELTATPDDSRETASNVLYSVSAAELKAEDMIKLPIRLTEHTEGWQRAVTDAYLTREKLALEAQKETDYIRPMVLFQADPKNGDVTVEVLKQFLLDELHIDDREIAIATGTQRELDGLDLFSPACPIKYIITIDALKEGWDCSFAYVFCSVRELKSNMAVEQLLGRVLRMPFARRRASEALNLAYAHLVSNSFAEVARKLTDKLVDMGFEAMEVPAYLQAGWATPLFNDQGQPQPREEPPLVLEIPHVPALEQLAAEHSAAIAVVETLPAGGCRVALTGEVAEPALDALTAGLKGVQKKEVVAQVAWHNHRVRSALAPAARGEPFAALPQLCYREQGELELLDKDGYLNLAGEWSLLDCPALLPQFSITETARTFEVDMDGQKVTFGVAQEQARYDLNQVDGHFTENDLVRWLEREARQPDISGLVLRAWLVRLVGHLHRERGMSITALERGKFVLARAILGQIARLREQAAQRGFNLALFEQPGLLETSSAYCYEFAPQYYPAREPFYQGRYRFQKHYYPVIEDLKAHGEETDCAIAIDMHPKVKHWIRNLVNRERASFSLPLAGRNFYPDFVAELIDGRLLVVEYKGESYRSNDDSREKNRVGEHWAASSSGKCLFLMAVKNDGGLTVDQQLDRVIGAAE